jgi:hypothetical protein
MVTRGKFMTAIVAPGRPHRLGYTAAMTTLSSNALRLPSLAACLRAGVAKKSKPQLI